MLYHVEDGKLVDVKGDADHPMTNGGLCVKLNDFAGHHYQPDRLMHPMRRVGPKGAGQFEEITWDEALAEIKRTMDVDLRRVRQPGDHAACLPGPPASDQRPHVR